MDTLAHLARRTGRVAHGLLLLLDPQGGQGQARRNARQALLTIEAEERIRRLALSTAVVPLPRTEAQLEVLSR